MISTHDFVTHVAAHAGVAADLAEQATLAVLAGIGSHARESCGQFVADELPPALAAAILADGDIAVPIEQRVLAPGMTAGHARELIASVCRVLVEELSTEAVNRLRDEVPAIAGYLVQPEQEAARAHGRPDSLAAGRPGSRHPISETPGRSEHSEAIGTENPHAETKLSSSPGSTQERRHETLAEGHPGGTRTVGRSHR